MLVPKLGSWALLLLVELAVHGSALPGPGSPDGLAGSDNHVPASRLAPHPSSSGGRKLKGRFLQITDIHPDPFYKSHSSSDKDHSCHRGKGDAGKYGAETTDCDSPYSLANQTFAWIKENIRDEVDFVVWTGDNARHDNDESIPRTRDQVISQNEFIVSKFLEVWGKKSGGDDDDPTNDFVIPIVPTLGNNDILPHNIFLDGPNAWSRKYLNLWRQFVPEEQRHQFQQGGWFWSEVIPGKLAVVSLNTLYFFAKNAAVDGCAPRSQPGYEHFEWLRVQLEMFRARGVKALIMGHVAPARTESKLSWDETCWQKYALWMEKYRDVVVGSFYGHMNIDHFIIQDFADIKKSTRRGAISEMDADAVEAGEDTEVGTASEKSYLVELRDVWSDIVTAADDDDDEDDSWFGSLKKGKKHNKDKHKENKKKKKKYLHRIGGKYAQRYAISHVSPSVIPNYFPTLRIYEYNITGLEDVASWPNSRNMGSWPAQPQADIIKSVQDEDFEDYAAQLEARLNTSQRTDDFSERWNADASKSKKKKKKGKKHKKKKRKYKFHVPDAPSKSSPPGPAYSPQTLSLLGFKQYYANLSFINSEVGLVSEEDLAAVPLVSPPVSQKPLGEETSAGVSLRRGKSAKFEYEVEYETRGDDVYKMTDLSVRSYVDLAREIGKKKKGDLFELNGDDGDDEATDADMDGIVDEEVRNWGMEQRDGLDGEEMNKKKPHGGNGGKKRKKKKKGKMNKVWYTFVYRAFVGSMDPEDIEDYFG